MTALRFPRSRKVVPGSRAGPDFRQNNLPGFHPFPPDPSRVLVLCARQTLFTTKLRESRSVTCMVWVLMIVKVKITFELRWTNRPRKRSMRTE